jgi:chemotaxis protein MotB
VSRKKKHPEHENHERWLVSYADFMTLLFAFFVVMFASANQDKAKAKAISEAVENALKDGHAAAKIAAVLGGTVDDRGQGNAMRKGPGGAQKSAVEPPPAPPPVVAELLPSLEFLNQELQQEIRAGRLKLSLEPRGLVVTLPQATYFPSGQDAIDPATFATLDKVAQVILKLPNPIRVEGHTDAMPIHNARFRSNWELSAARSIAMLELLTTRFKIPRDRLAVAGYAENVPVAPNETEEGRARNRRVDLVILNKMGLLREPIAVPEKADPPAASHK